MGISYWKIAIFFLIITASALLIIPSRRELGRFYFQQHKYTHARFYLESHYKDYPTDVKSSVRYLEVLQNLGHKEDVEKYGEQALKYSPKSVALHNEMAEYYAGNFRFKEAARHWDQMVRENPNLKDVRDKLISYYMLNHRFSDLAALYESEIRKGYATKEVYYELGNLYLMQKKPKAAYQVYHELINKFPNEIIARERLAMIADYLGYHKEVMQLYQEIITLDPNNPYYAVEYIDYLYEYHHYHKALEIALAYSKRFPNDTSIQARVPDIYLQLGEKQKALDAYRILYEKDPKRTSLLLTMAGLYHDLDQPEKAKKLLEEYHQHNKGTPYSHYLMGTILAKEGLKKEARAQFLLALNELEEKKFLKEDQAELYVSILWELDRKDEARKMAYLYLKSYPNNSSILLIAVLSAINDKDYEEAEKLIARYKESGGEWKAYKELEVSLYLAQRKWKKAGWALRDLIDRYPKNWDYHTDYAYTMTRLNRWAEAMQSYQILVVNGRLRRDLIDDYRDVLLRSGTIADGHFVLNYGPETVRHYEWYESLKHWINYNWFVEVLSNQERHLRDNVGGEPVNWTVAGYLTRLGWLPTNFFKQTAYFHNNYSDDRGFAEFGGESDLFYTGYIDDVPYTLNGIVKGYYNHLVREPIDALPLEGRKNSLYLLGSGSIANRFNATYTFWIDWYKINRHENKINGMSSLGHKYFNEISNNLLLLSQDSPTWDLTLNVTYYFANWVKSFGAADTLIDFIDKEKILYIGPFFTARFSSHTLFRGSIQRKWEIQRHFWATFSNVELESWIKRNIYALFRYEYIYHDSSLDGTGNSSIFTGHLQIIF